MDVHSLFTFTLNSADYLILYQSFQSSKIPQQCTSLSEKCICDDKRTGYIKKNVEIRINSWKVQHDLQNSVSECK